MLLQVLLSASWFTHTGMPWVFGMHKLDRHWPGELQVSVGSDILQYPPEHTIP